MPVYETRPSAESYGHAIGIVLLDCRVPYIPGDVANADTFEFPVLFKTVPGLSTAACLSGAPGFADLVAEAALQLEQQGVKAIASGCGFMLQFQDAVASKVKIPVCLSSLSQLPMIGTTVGSRPIGIISADSTKLTEEFIRSAMPSLSNQLVIRGMQDSPEFRTSLLEEKGTLDSDLIEMEVVEVVKKMLRDVPDIGAILLECSDLPPYANAVQRATGLPVFDFVTLVNYLHSATHPVRYAGGY